jgi:hypothetical protein
MGDNGNADVEGMSMEQLKSEVIRLRTQVD